MAGVTASALSTPSKRFLVHPDVVLHHRGSGGCLAGFCVIILAKYASQISRLPRVRRRSHGLGSAPRLRLIRGASGVDRQGRPLQSNRVAPPQEVTNRATIENGRRLLEQCALFRTLDEEARQELVSHAHRRSFDQGERIFHVGSPGQSMMAVLAGTVRISLTTAKGKEIVLADLSAGELFGEMALLDGKERSADATALSKCELLVLERRDVIPFLRLHPDSCLQLLEMLSTRLRRLDEQMAEIAFVDLPARLAKTLLRTAQPSGRGNQQLKLSLSQSDLAKMIGATRETVNRCLRDWQRRGILDLKGGWTIILKPDALEDLAG
jgi:CRP/FNR family cyclic AMP-dependent transcriptional regulator